MKKFNILEWVVFVLVVIGGLNWGLIGFFGFNLVTYIFGDFSMITRVVYDLVGLAALYWIYWAYKWHS